MFCLFDMLAMLCKYVSSEALVNLEAHYKTQLDDLLRRVHDLEHIVKHLETGANVGGGQADARPYQELAGPVHPEEPFLSG